MKQNPTDFEVALAHFATDVSLAVALEQGGRLTQQQAYDRIKRRWKLLKALRKDGMDPIT